MFHFLHMRRKFPKISELALIMFITSLALALVNTIWSVYLFDIFQSDVIVGLISAVFTGVSLLSFVYLIPFVERHDKPQLYRWSLIASGILYLFFAFTSHAIFVIILGVILSILSVIRIDSFGIIVRDCSKDDNLGKNEGIIYVMMNLGWLLGPLAAGFLSDTYGIPLVFVITAFFLFFSLLTYHLLHIHCKPRIYKRIDGNLLQNVKEFFSQPDLIKSYIVSGSGSVWYSFIFVFIPLYIIEQGLSIDTIAYFFFATQIPLIFLEYSIGKFADKHHYRLLFIMGNAVLALILLACFFTSNIYLILTLLALGCIGIAMFESPTEAYFFLISPKKHLDKYYSVYNTTLDFSGTLAKILISGTLAFLSFKYSFLILAFVFIGIMCVAFTMKEPHTENRPKPL